MREILFRGKNIDLKWVEGDLLQNGVDYKTAIRTNKEGLVERVISHTVGQFTGLYDSTKWEDLTDAEKEKFYNSVKTEDGKTIKYPTVENVKSLWKGKKIFEGDILRIGYCFGWDSEQEKKVPEEEYISKVYSIDCCPFCVDLQHCDGDVSPVAWLDWSYGDTEIEVIGNIHDNPELLKEGVTND